MTARDGRGGVTNDSVQLTVDSAAGPFLVTSQSSSFTWTGGTQQTITWSVNNTGSGSSVNCASVKISLSVDGGNTFPYVLASSTVNDGSEPVTLQNGLTSSQARVKVEAVGNVFFDISDMNFTVTPGCSYSINPASANLQVGGGSNSVTVTATTGCTWTAISNAAWITINSGASGTGNGIVGYSVAANTGATRIGTMTIAGQTFTVTQAGTGLMFYPLAAPVRLLETRPGQSGCFTPGAKIPGGTSRTQVARGTCGIPANAQAVIGNITTVESGGGYLTVYPSSNASVPDVTNSHYVANQILNNVFTVGLGSADGAFKIFVSSNTDVTVDISGYYAPPFGGLYFHPLPTPIRLLETRQGQSGCFTPGAPLAVNSDTAQQGRVTCNGVTIPNNALALVGNATTVNPQDVGWLTFFPADASRPWVSNANYVTGQILNTPFTVGLSSSGQFKIYTKHTTDLVVDVVGYYSTDVTDLNGAGMLFSPLATPTRLLDTRAGQTACFTGVIRQAETDYWQQARGLCSIGSNAAGIVGNATVHNPSAPYTGWLTFYPSNTARPWIATSNYEPGQVFGRHFTVALGTDGAFMNYSRYATNLSIDVFGFFAP